MNLARTLRPTLPESKLLLLVSPTILILITFVLKQQKIITIYRLTKTPTTFKITKPVIQQSVYNMIGILILDKFYGSMCHR